MNRLLQSVSYRRHEIQTYIAQRKHIEAVAKTLDRALRLKIRFSAKKQISHKTK